MVVQFALQKRRLVFNLDMASPRRTARTSLYQVLSRTFTLSARPLTISPFFGQSRVLGYVDVLAVEVLHALGRHHSALCPGPLPMLCGCPRHRPGLLCSGMRGNQSGSSRLPSPPPRNVRRHHRAITLTLLDTKICIRRFGTGNESVRQSTSSGIAPFDNCPH
jgi:hypothetical protein